MNFMSQNELLRIAQASRYYPAVLSMTAQQLLRAEGIKSDTKQTVHFCGELLLLSFLQISGFFFWNPLNIFFPWYAHEFVHVYMFNSFSVAALDSQILFKCIPDIIHGVKALFQALNVLKSDYGFNYSWRNYKQFEFIDQFIFLFTQLCRVKKCLLYQLFLLDWVLVHTDFFHSFNQ